MSTRRFPPTLGIVQRQARWPHLPVKAIKEPFGDQLGVLMRESRGKPASARRFRPLELATRSVFVLLVSRARTKASRLPSRDHVGCANASALPCGDLMSTWRWLPSGRSASKPLSGPAVHPVTIVRPSGDHAG